MARAFGAVCSVDAVALTGDDLVKGPHASLSPLCTTACLIYL